MENINKTALIKELRERTDAPMVDCKKALESSEWNVEKAIVWLQENGKAKAAKKAGRIAAEGLVSAAKNEKYAVIFEVNSETDFVAQNKQFIDLVNKIGNILLNNTFSNSEEALNLKDESGKSIDDLCVDATATIGEKIAFRRAEKIEIKETQKAGTYVHTNGRVASIVLVNGDSEEAAKNVSMQVAALNPEYTLVSEVPASVVNKLKEEFAKEIESDAKFASKPEKIKQSMIEGKLNKELSKNVLELQDFVMDSAFKVNTYLQSKKSELVKSLRFEVGEGIEKQETDFAAEVAAQVAEARKNN
ncbi:translation elongation factor Ts [Mesomycoplasma molare]|uniref:Elongation factor Ts n=1 Tax=Mesomycoplasma molare TaxID=171288 RepID=A0ABY5TUI4_9BACT|nr:translation elongation factor Ts [Mesomycoplasma molare]UWD33910.1 translation elongation factor Ts [Mesomycoplasma molare]